MARVLFLTALCWSAWNVAGLAQPTPPAAKSQEGDESDALMFAWLDTLGFSDLANRRFVRVATHGDAILIRSLRPSSKPSTRSPRHR